MFSRLPPAATVEPPRRAGQLWAGVALPRRGRPSATARYRRARRPVSDEEAAESAAMDYGASGYAGGRTRPPSAPERAPQLPRTLAGLRGLTLRRLARLPSLALPPWPHGGAGSASAEVDARERALLGELREVELERRVAGGATGGATTADAGGVRMPAARPAARAAAAPPPPAGAVPSPFSSGAGVTGGSGPASRPVYVRLPEAAVPEATTRPAAGPGDGVSLLLGLNGLVALARSLSIPSPALLDSLALAHWAPRPWQWATASFCHASWGHLTSNAFGLLVFGRAVEEELGTLGVVLVYILCGAAGLLASWVFSSPDSISLGASASVFGLFVVAAAAKVRANPRSLLEAAVLASFAAGQLRQEIMLAYAAGRAGGAPGIASVSHVAHVAGAGLGGGLALAIVRARRRGRRRLWL